MDKTNSTSPARKSAEQIHQEVLAKLLKLIGYKTIPDDLLQTNLERIISSCYAEREKAIGELLSKCDATTQVLRRHTLYTTADILERATEVLRRKM